MDPHQTDTAARTVGRYEILRQIGQGGMATVYLARQTGLDREVALKELDRFGVADQRVFTSRFVREAKLAGSLGHPNIVTVLDYFEHEGRPYIAMEYLEGGSLREYLGDLSDTQVVGVLEGLLAGLTHAESRGIAHRDIKPENILVTGEGRVKLADFGIARAYNAALSVLTVAGTTVGTPRYMAPEQATGQQLSAATDLYAVGVVAYEMLVGHVPFDSDENALAIVWQHVNDPLPDPRAARPDLDPRLCRWLEELLAKDPTDRPPSAHAALDALEEIVLDMLGGRWRRDARLAAPRVASESARPLTPARVEKVVDELAGVRLDDGAEGDATIVPRALRDRTALLRSLGRERRARAAAPPSPVARRRRLLAPLAGSTIVAAIAGYAVFAGAPPAEHAATQAPAARSAAVLADEATRQRFVVEMTTVLQRLATAHDDALKRLGRAGTAPAQAKVARLIAGAYGAAAAASSGLAPAASQRRPATQVREQLRRAGRDYAGLAAAAKRHAAGRYDAAARAIAADEAKLDRLVARIPS
jgi:tRNA A-37 threonylcarbamoyl transferase component Bud32